MNLAIDKLDSRATEVEQTKDSARMFRAICIPGSLNQPISEEEIRTALGKLHNQRATGGRWHTRGTAGILS